jgi:hypothetical protein
LAEFTELICLAIQRGFWDVAEGSITAAQ